MSTINGQCLSDHLCDLNCIMCGWCDVASYHVITVIELREFAEPGENGIILFWPKVIFEGNFWHTA